MKRYNVVNDALGWLCFVIAAVTYLLTLEPTASFWDCPEFISQAFKLEVGHPPGNPIFMLAGRFFVNFTGGDVTKVALAVNSMSALLSAGTILLLFWTVTHLVKRLIVADDAQDVTLTQLIVIMASGLTGALAYTWSDTFWFSAVEGEVYAFSSFCTALVVWLIFKWENRADLPHSDRYLVLIAYVIGISIAVHLLNLLCIPAIALVVYYRKWKNTTAKGSLITLAISAVVVALILYGLVPGFIEVAQYFELFFVNTLGTSYNMGVLVYAVLLVASLVWCIRCLYRQTDRRAIKWSFIISVILSGIPFIGESLWIPVVIVGALAFYLFYYCPRHTLPLRVLSLTALSILVMFVGYSSYALLLIRSDANPPMNQNAPDNVFSLGSYLSREQYGENPLLYGQSFKSTIIYEVDRNNMVRVRTTPGKTLYSKVTKTNPDEPDRYVATGEKINYKWTPEMLFPRMYSTAPDHPAAYLGWIGAEESDLPYVEVQNYLYEDGTPVTDAAGNPYTTYAQKPTMMQNLRYFINYQLNYMYWRYFLWNFAGRQNDLQGQGEPNRGNWISGFSFIDDRRLGDQELLPAEMGKDNKGHNVFYMMPLLLGIIGLLWQAFYSKRGIEQFWVVFFLFFMTGIAIVLYLNQPPLQPRERDYAFAGSFYAYAIWIGVGVAALYTFIKYFLTDHKKQASGTADAGAESKNRKPLTAAIAAAVIGLIVPLQMVSQTWDDHDRSGRYTTRDFGMNYLSSVDENGIIFTNGDNDTFPLWYAQEVEGYRTDVRVVNLSYLTTDWYVNQMQHPTYEAAAIDMIAKPEDYAYDRLQYSSISNADTLRRPLDAEAALRALYKSAQEGNGVLPGGRLAFPVDVDASVKAGVINEREAAVADNFIMADLGTGGVTLSKAISLDMIATSAANGWNRPAYFAMTVPNSYYLGLPSNMQSTGLAYQVTPIYNESDGYNIAVNTDKMYRNVTERFRWGGLDSIPEGETVYLDETVRRMVTTHRSAMVDLATALYNEGVEALKVDSTEVITNPKEWANDRFEKAAVILNLMTDKLPTKHSPYGIQIGEQVGDLYTRLGEQLDRPELTQRGLDILQDEIIRWASYEPYLRSLRRLGLYNQLSRTDRYSTAYTVNLIQAFYDGGGDIEELGRRLDEVGIDLTGILDSAYGGKQTVNDGGAINVTTPQAPVQPEQK
ncbi:MAG: DUF2723 domain-containing protein [Muribaculaceae bacterium]|nr:DUF2723 domain-containing protein [Muribaculaceae bacterium]